MNRNWRFLGVLTLFFVFFGGVCDPNDSSSPIYRIRISAVLTSDDDGSHPVYDGYTKDELIDGIEDWVETANGLYSNFMHVEFDFDRNTDVRELRNTVLNRLAADSWQLFDGNQCQQICIERRNDGTCLRAKSCINRDVNGACKSAFFYDASTEPSCDAMLKQSRDAGNFWAVTDQGKLTVFFRYGPGVDKTGQGFSFPGLENHFVAMPDFWSTSVRIYRNDPANPIITLPNCETAPARTARCMRADGWVFAQNRLLLAHEIGHYLGLSHTFTGGFTDPADSKWKAFDSRSQIAYAFGSSNGDKSIFNGDGLSDTTEDPGTAAFSNSIDTIAVDPCTSDARQIEGNTASGLWFRYTFNSGKYSLMVDDFKDITTSSSFSPPIENIMSYFVCGMTPKTQNVVPVGEDIGRFTPMQGNWVRSVLKGDRKWVLCKNPDNEALSTCTTSPGGGADEIIEDEEGLTPGTIQKTNRAIQLRKKKLHDASVRMRNMRIARPAAHLGCDTN